MKNPPVPATDVVVIGASTGGVEALRQLVAGLPSGFPAAVLIVTHIGRRDSILPSILASVSILPVRHARHGDLVEAGRILIAPPDLHLTLVRDGDECRVVLARTAKENFTRPAIDPLFRSAAATFGRRAIGVILTGALDDGTAGLAAIKACGGGTIVQDPDEAMAPEMPNSAIANVEVDHVLRLEEIPRTLAWIVNAGAQARAAIPREDEVPHWVHLENKFAVEGVDMDSLDKIAKPSTFTCPECHGALWEMENQKPLRFRCHTGHAYTERSLVALQVEAVEDAVWAAMRSLQERTMLLHKLAEEALTFDRVDAATEYTAQAAEAQQSAEVLRGLISRVPDKVS
jgi:two-component system chemotaxis response regulator CheB